jgi:peptidyl-prolyl cis-trans isomerase D
MLKFFNRLEKTRNFVLLIFAVIMVLSLVLFFSPTQNTVTANLARSEETAATVSGEKITVGELYRTSENYSRFTQGRPYPPRLLLNGLISSRITRVEAERLGLTGSDAEVAAVIREQFKTTDGTPFNQQVYEQNVTEQYGSVAAFEQSVRDDIAADKLRAFISSGVTVSEDELVKDFQKKNTKFDVNYVSVNSTELSQTLTPTEQELRDYFEKNKQAYYISVPQKKIRYIFISTAKIGEKLPITEAELQEEWNKLPPDKRIAGVKGREIVLRVAKPEFDSQVLAKANDLITRLRKDGPEVSEQLFAELARGQSENAASAAKGGELSGPVRENLNNPTDPYQRLLKMKPGEITEPISYQGRYFILRRGEEVAKTFETARKELEVSLRNRRAYAVAAELAQKVADALKQNKDVNATAAQFASQANMTPAEMIRETGYVKPGDDVENIGNSPDFEAGIAPLENVSDVGDKTPIQNGFAIPTLADRKEPRDSEFEEVRGQLVDVVKLEKARGMVEEIAKQIAAGAGSASGITAAAQSKGLKAQEQKTYIVGSPLGQGPSASTSEALEDAIFAMKEGEVSTTPIKVGENWYIVGVTKRTDPTPDEFAKQRTSLMESLLTQKRGEVFAEYLASTRRRMEADGSIKVYDSALAKLEAPAEPIDIPEQP